jgi:hypothetical protein
MYGVTVCIVDIHRPFFEEGIRHDNGGKEGTDHSNAD